MNPVVWKPVVWLCYLAGGCFHLRLLAGKGWSDPLLSEPADLAL